MAMSINKMHIPHGVTTAREPPASMPGMASITPPKSRLWPVPTHTSMWHFMLRVINPATAEQSALPIIMPSPSQVNEPLSAPPILSAIMPTNPSTQPATLLPVRRSVEGYTAQASSTKANTLSELSMAAREPALCDSPM